MRHRPQPEPPAYPPPRAALRTLCSVITAKSLARLVGVCILAGLVLAGILFPVFGGAGVLINRASDAVDSTSSEVLEGEAPAVTTVLDATGAPIAWLYDQRRFEVPSREISETMKLAQVSIEDRRFTSHRGVDWQGTLRAFLTNTSSGEIQQGASTIDQQYIKNYQLFVVAQTDAERRAAVETTAARKMREIRMALTLDKTLSKDEILTRYLNLVPFGNGSYGVQDAAQTYFGIDAKDLDLPQSAMLAGIVQSPSHLNPYTNPEDVTARRNVVLDSMVTAGAITPDEARAAKEEPLGVLEEPQTLPRGCIAAGDRGFFCDYVVKYLSDAGFSSEQLNRGGYEIHTTLDPRVQQATQEALAAEAPADLSGIAAVMNVVAPGHDQHRVLAMGSSREYGLDAGREQTVQPQPFSMVGDGAGSVFKIFTTAVALGQGLGLDDVLDVPSFFAAQGMGHGGAAGCPADSYCVRNVGDYPPALTLTQALAQSPNTTFVKMIQDVGVAPSVDMAVKLGLRSYADPGSSGLDERSLAQVITDENSGSFVLGPTPVNTLELANVGATLASDGMWCPPSPIDRVIDRHGDPVTITEQPCEQVVEPDLAHALSAGMGEDALGSGTAAGSAAASGWTAPVSAKTGTTEAFRSAAFLAFTPSLSAATYIYNDGTRPGPICTSPLRSCGRGDIYGGIEPARIWFRAISAVAGDFPPPELPAVDERFEAGSGGVDLPAVVGRTESSARARLEGAGFEVQIERVADPARRGTVIDTAPQETALPGSTVVMRVSDGPDGG